MTAIRSISKNQPGALSIWIAMLCIYLVWGSTYLAIHFAVQTMPPLLMVAVRFLIAGGILYAYQRVQGDPAPTRTEWRSSAIIGFFLLVCGNGGVTLAEQHVPSGIAALVVGSSPLWMVLIDLLRPGKAVERKRPSGLTIAGVLLGFVGIALLVEPSGLTGLSGSVDTVGAIILTLAAFLWAVGSLYSREAKLPASALLSTGMEMIAGGTGLLLLGTLSGEWGRVNLSGISSASLLGLVYLIVFGSLVGFTAYTWLLRVAPTTLVSTHAFINPFIAIFLGNLLAKEPLTPRVLIAASVILSAVALITINQPVSAKVEKTEPVFSSGDD